MTFVNVAVVVVLLAVLLLLIRANRRPRQAWAPPVAPGEPTERDPRPYLPTGGPTQQDSAGGAGHARHATQAERAGHREHAGHPERAGHPEHAGHAGQAEHAGHAASFDERAATWDADPAKVERARSVARAILGLVPTTGTTRFLEYGAGTGLLTEELRGMVGSVTLVDTSAGMRDVMATKVADGRLPADARIWDLDLSVAAPAVSPEDRVDVVATVLALHHVDDVEAVLRGFAGLLDDGGRVCVMDLDREDGSFHGDGVDIHHGFDRAEITVLLEGAGFVDVAVHDCVPLIKEDGVFSTFLAVGVRRR